MILSLVFFVLLHLLVALLTSYRISRHGLKINIHGAINNLFGWIVLDGEIWYLLYLYQTPFLLLFLLNDQSSIPFPPPSSLFELLLIIFVRCGRGFYLEAQTLIQSASQKVNWSLTR